MIYTYKMEYVKDTPANYFIKQLCLRPTLLILIMMMTFIAQFENFCDKESYKSLLTVTKVQNFLWLDL